MYYYLAFEIKVQSVQEFKVKTTVYTYSSSHLRDLNLEIVARTHSLLLFHGRFNMRWASKETGPEYTPKKKIVKYKFNRRRQRQELWMMVVNLLRLTVFYLCWVIL